MPRVIHKDNFDACAMLLGLQFVHAMFDCRDTYRFVRFYSDGRCGDPLDLLLNVRDTDVMVDFNTKPGIYHYFRITH